MNIYDILHREHVEVLGHVEKLASAVGDDVRRNLLRKVVDELTAHTVAEEAVLYDRLADTGTGRSLVLEAKEEHLVVTRLLEDLVQMRVDDERFPAKVKVLGENLRHHVDEEETEVWAQARSFFDDDIAMNFGGEYVALRDELKRRPKLLRLGSAKMKRAVETLSHVIDPQPHR
jgi:hemerythrin superfamily protein